MAHDDQKPRDIGKERKLNVWNARLCQSWDAMLELTINGPHMLYSLWIGTALNDAEVWPEDRKTEENFPIDFRAFGLLVFARSSIDYWNSLSHMKPLRNLVHYAVAISATTSTLAVCLRLIYFK